MLGAYAALAPKWTVLAQVECTVTSNPKSCRQLRQFVVAALVLVFRKLTRKIIRV